MKKLNERTMAAQEKRIPQLAENAVKQARTRTLKAGRSVVEAVDGKLVETRPDGSVKEIRSLASPTQVPPEKRKIRRTK
jgi:hypothetical protein